MIIANNVLPNASPLCHDLFVDAFSFEIYHIDVGLFLRVRQYHNTEWKIVLIPTQR